MCGGWYSKSKSSKHYNFRYFVIYCRVWSSFLIWFFCAMYKFNLLWNKKINKNGNKNQKQLTLLPPIKAFIHILLSVGLTISFICFLHYSFQLNGIDWKRNFCKLLSIELGYFSNFGVKRYSKQNIVLRYASKMLRFFFK